MTYAAAVVGTGDPDGDGFAMAYQHADAYRANDACDVVACADVVPENAEAFAAEYGLPDENVFTDYEEMAAEVEPDIVSVCVPPAFHADIVVDLARIGTVGAVHCEKPMDLTWGGARQMAQECWRRDVQLTFNHQRRFGKPFRKAKSLLDAGEIGDLERVAFAAPNFYDYGSHSVDLSNYFNDERGVEWVIGQVDYRDRNLAFGAHNANQVIAQWEYENGVNGLGVTGRGRDLVGAHNRLVGTDGEIEILWDADPPLRVRRAGDEEWEAVDCDDEDVHGPGFIQRAIDDVVGALDTGRESELCARNALTATEVIFSAWESSRRRGRVDLPLEINDNPLEDMVERGDLQPASPDDAS